MRRLTLFLLLPLAACGTPQEQCIRAGMKDLNVVEGLIDETEQTLARGYGLRQEERTDFHLEDCTPAPTAEMPNPARRSCYVPVKQQFDVPVAVDLTAEKAKLASLKQTRLRLERATGPMIADCRARFPE